MLDEFLRVLEEGPKYWAYGLIVAASAVEYVLPMVPGDTVTLFAVVLAARAQLDWLWVYGLMTGGAVFGGTLAWAFGVWLADHEDDWPRLLRRPQATRALDAVRRGYDRHGSVYLAVNRFIPALRAFFFVGAGLSRMSLGPVLLFGGLSAAAWNAMLLAVGYAVGDNWDALSKILDRYTVGALALVVVVVLVLAARHWLQRTRG